MAQSPVSPGSQPAQSSPAAPARKPRSSGEKIVVWGGIIVLLAVVAYQARARLGYNMTLKALEGRLAQDEGVDGKALLAADLDNYIVGWPSREVSEKSKFLKTVKLTWPGLTSSFVMTVEIDPSEEPESGGSVTAVQTSGYEDPPAPEIEMKPMPEPGAEAAPPAGAEPPDAAPAPEGAAAEPATQPAAETPAATPEAVPATESPAAETPAGDAPAAETPAAETPAAETPAATEPATGN